MFDKNTPKKEDMSWTEKIMLKKLIKKLRKIINIMEEKNKELKETTKTREKLIMTNIEITKIFEVTNEKTGKELEEEDFRKMTTKNLTENIKIACKKLEEIT